MSEGTKKGLVILAVVVQFIVILVLIAALSGKQETIREVPVEKVVYREDIKMKEERDFYLGVACVYTKMYTPMYNLAVEFAKEYNMTSYITRDVIELNVGAKEFVKNVCN